MKKNDFIGRERSSGLQYLSDLRATAQQIYLSALIHDRLPPDTQFAVFSSDNPFLPYYERALNEYAEALRSFRALGYTGLSLGADGRATLYSRRARRKSSARNETGAVGRFGRTE